MDTIAASCLIGSASRLHVNRIGIKSRMSSNSGQIRPGILDLLALERL